MTAPQLVPSVTRHAEAATARLEPTETPAVRVRRSAKRANSRRATGGNRGERQGPPVSRDASHAPAEQRSLERIGPIWTSGWLLPGAGPDGFLRRQFPDREIARLWWRGDIASAYVAERLGVDLGDVLTLTDAAERNRIADAMHGFVYTKRRRKKPRNCLDHEWVSEPIDRSVRVWACGHLRPAFRGFEIGIAHWHCRDRLCPDCAERRAREYASAARPFVESRKGAVLFVTLTQVKRPTHRESAAAAFERLMVTWRKCQNKKSLPGRRFAACFVGGARAVELKYTQRGEQKRKHRILYSGWHPHLHLLLEVRDGVTVAEASRALLEIWGGAAKGSDDNGQNVQLVDERRIGQLCKYPLKLPPLVSVDVIREAAIVLADRKTLVGFGTWRAFLKEGRILRDQREERPRAPIHMADQRLGSLARPDGVISFTKRRGRMWAAEFRDLRAIRDSILADPRTFAQRDRDQKRLDDELAGENELREQAGLPEAIMKAPRAPSPGRRSWWDRFAPPPIGPPKPAKQAEQIEWVFP